MSLNTQLGTQVFSVEVITNGDTINIITGSAIEYVYLIEDIFSLSITGKIVFWDRVGLMETGPINGNEIFRITFGNTAGTGDYRQIDMKVQKINKVTPESKARMAENLKLELILVDENYQKLHSNGWNKAWNNTQISKIIKDICKSHIGIDNFSLIEESNEVIEHFDTHLRTPAESIIWLMNRASGIKSGQSGYLFYRYNNHNKKEFEYALITLEQLLSQKKYMSPVGDNNVYGFEQQNPMYINKINDYKLLHLDLTALKSLSGGSLLGYDIKRKKLIRRNYSYTDAIDRFTILGRKTLFSSDMFIDRPRKQIDGCSDEQILDNIWYGNWIKEYCNQQLLEITVQGHEMRHAGGLIRILWPSYYEETEVQNKQMDGKYLIKSITHYLSNNVTGGYKQKLVCIKNGYGDSSNKNLVKSKKFNM
ncbi:MAG: hypothetical protein KQ78_01300 [Candidatus Izimaplasma bacterium HR2]|nr:MAG: hypothetical protein KQ78_01300 [Candidatus Izimaplasma bacterium HR2]